MLKQKPVLSFYMNIIISFTVAEGLFWKNAKQQIIHFLLGEEKVFVQNLC